MGKKRSKRRKLSGDERLRRALSIASLGVGIASVVAPREVGRALGVKGRKARDGIFDFGLAEIAAGAAVLHDPRNSANLWVRLGEEGIDLLALAMAMLGSKRRGRVAAAMGLVAALMLADILAARRFSAAPA